MGCLLETSTDLQFPAAHSRQETWNLVYPSTLFLERCSVNFDQPFSHTSLDESKLTLGINFCFRVFRVSLSEEPNVLH